MKKLIGLAIFIGLIVFLYSSCPDKDDHTEALSDSVTEIISSQVPGMDAKTLSSIEGMDDILKWVGNNMVDVDNYFVFSLGKMDLGGEEQVVSLGIGGHVFTFNDKIVKEGANLYQKGSEALKGLFN
jgi:hypothetical protein